MGQVLDILHKHNVLNDDVIKDVRTFIRENRTFKPEGDNTGDVTKANKKVMASNSEVSWVGDLTTSVADPGFSKGAPTLEGALAYYEQLAKNCMKMKKTSQPRATTELVSKRLC